MRRFLWKHTENMKCIVAQLFFFMNIIQKKKKIEMSHNWVEMISKKVKKWRTLMSVSNDVAGSRVQFVLPLSCLLPVKCSKIPDNIYWKCSWRYTFYWFVDFYSRTLIPHRFLWNSIRFSAFDFDIFRVTRHSVINSRLRTQKIHTRNANIFNMVVSTQFTNIMELW